MRIRLRDAAIAVVTAGVVAAVQLALPRTSGPTLAAQGPQLIRRADGKPDLSGIWQANSGAHWDLLAHSPRPMVAQPGVYRNIPVLAAPVLALGTIGWVPPDAGVVEGDEIPYQPWAAKRKQENFDNWLDRDPEVKCYLPGVPRAMYMPYKFQIIQGTNKIMMVFEFNGAERTIHLDEVQPYPADAYMGHSVAHWEGDTLVVDVTRFTAQTWLDRAGDFHSDALHVVERYTPITRDAFQYEATLEDPNVFTRPWKIRLPIYRRLEPNAQLMEFRCPEMAEETVLGHLRKEQLVKTWEGKTMRVDITRKIPPGDAVYERHVDGNPPPR
ncbi:MAG: hypothetical protein DMF89_24650 [Acidobacteria bacterium]|nr:MAG: hypothetical protein DMF90_08050 [Acidobacteriota bacterium]PYR45593.1 MAG: hypothetical protein DMF89_24650 [Acidobacteriota bacterium]